MKMKRAPLLGAVIILLIMVLLLTIGSYKYINLKKTNEALQLTIDDHREIIEVLSKDNAELKEKVTELEEQLKKNKTLTNQQGTTLNDRETLARLVFLEANTESLECQKAVASVVINRMHSGYWGNTINSVVSASGQFTTASQIHRTTPTATNYEAVDYVLTNGVTIPSYVLYFRARHHFSWSGYVPYTTIDNTYFGYIAKDKR